MASFRTFPVVIAALLLEICAPSADAAGAPVKGAGATFPEPAYAEWARLFAAATGERVVYAGVGSGKGVEAVEASRATFGATDAPLGDDALDKASLVQFPTLIGGILPVVDLPGIGPGELVLDGPALADLFVGRITFWDDAALRRLNPRLPLPHLAVVPVRRSDASGTTAVFAAYLAKASPGGRDWLGRSAPEPRPVGVAAEGSRGVAEAVAARPGAIGYLGFDYAQANRLSYVDLVNAEGRPVQPTLASIAAAGASADWAHGLAPSLVDPPGPASWPITTATYVLVPRRPPDAAAAGTALRFFAWSMRAGGPVAEDLGFVPLPDAAAAAVRASWGSVVGASGAPLAPP